MFSAYTSPIPSINGIVNIPYDAYQPFTDNIIRPPNIFDMRIRSNVISDNIIEYILLIGPNVISNPDDPNKLSLMFIVTYSNNNILLISELNYNNNGIAASKTKILNNKTCLDINDWNFTVEVKLSDKNNNIYPVGSTPPFELNDNYTIHYNFCSTRFSIISIFRRNPPGDFGSNGTGTVTSSLKNANILVPAINISGQRLIDFSDVGNTVFRILDKYSYYNSTSSKNDGICTLDSISPEELKETIFDKACPKMVSIVKGKGNTLLDKLNYIFDTFDIDIYFGTFYDNIILYGMTKYILSRLLYGNFDINYLLRKCNDRFLIDLSHSRFCNFLQFFSDPTYIGYDKYFRYNN